jgi:hypothetical protein
MAMRRSDCRSDRRNIPDQIQKAIRIKFNITRDTHMAMHVGATSATLTFPFFLLQPQGT